MTKRFVCILFLMFALSGICLGQNLSNIAYQFPCGWVPSPPTNLAPACPGIPCANYDCDCPAYRDGVDPISGNPVRKVRVVFHLVREDDGDCPVTLADVDALMAAVNDVYRGRAADSHLNAYPWLPWATGQFDSRIEFCWETRLYDETANLFVSANTFLSTHNVTLGTELHAVMNYGIQLGWGTLGMSAWIRYQDIANPKVLSHEFGHALGLGHPFDALGCNACEENQGLPANLRDQLNDYCSDTDADPQPWDYNCNNLGSPPPCPPIILGGTKYNVMGYAPNVGSCRSVVFTPQQGNRMRCFLANQFNGNLTVSPGSPCVNWLEADLIGAPRRPCVGQPVQFYSQSVSNGAMTYQWSFGDGGFSTLQNPSHAYALPGTYTVSLSVTAWGSTETRTRQGYIVVGTQSVPYLQAFDAPQGGYNDELPADWDAMNIQKPFTAWQRITALDFTDVQSPYPSANVWATLIGFGNPFFVPHQVPVVNPNGTTGGAMAINNTLRHNGDNSPLTIAGTLGDRDTLLSPVFDLSHLPNPRMRFAFAHVPAAINGAPSCDWSYSNPAIGPGSAINTYGSLASQCGLTSNYATCVDNRISVKVSTDCGTSWVPLTDIAARNWNRAWCIDLNTAPGKCCPFGFVPQEPGNWDEAVFDLCGVMGLANVRFMFEYEHSGNNNFFWIDDFAIESGPAQPWQTGVTVTHVDESCGSTLGAITVAVPGPGPYDIQLADQFGAITSVVGVLTHTFTGLQGAPGGQAYFITITDGAGNCLRWTESVNLSGALVYGTQVTNACPGSGGSITVTGLPTGLYDYTISLNGSALPSGTGLAGPSFTIPVQSLGTYLLTVTDQAGGACNTQLVQVLNTGSLVPTFDLNYDCQFLTGSLDNIVPASGFTYNIWLANGPLVATSTTMPIPAPGATGLPWGNYILEVTGTGGCGQVPFTVTQPPTTLSYTCNPSPDNGCAPPNGGLEVIPSIPGNYSYQLLDVNQMPIGPPNTTGVWTGLPAGNYGVVMTNLDPPYDCYSDFCTVYPYTQNVINAFQGWPNTNCVGPPNGHLQFFIRGPLASNTIDVTITNLTTGTVIFPTGFPAFPLVAGAFQTGVGYPYSLNDLPAGVYEISVTHTGGCQTVQIVITNSSTPLPYTTTVSNACSGTGGSITFNAVIPIGPYDYSWSLNGGPVTTVTGQPSPYTLSSLVPGTYTVTMAASGGGACTTSQVTVTNFGNLLPTANVIHDCVNGTATIVPTAPGTSGYTFTLYTLGQVPTGSMTVPPGVYLLEVVGNSDCGWTVVDASDPSPGWGASLITVADATCGSNGSLEVAGSPSGGYTYELLNTSLPSNTTGLFSGLAAGTYDVLVSDGNGGCEIVQAAIANASLAPSATVSYDCITGTAVVTPTAPTGSGYTFVLFDAGHIPVPVPLTIPGPGIYTLEVSGNNACGAITINATDFSPGWSASGTVTAATCGSNGSVNVLASPAGAYTYELVNMGLPLQNNGQFGNLAAGAYQVLVQDGNGGCELVSLAVPYTGNIYSVTPAANTACFAPWNGTINVGSGGGQTNYTITVMQGSTVVYIGPPLACTGSICQSLITGLAPGSYTVSVDLGGTVCFTQQVAVGNAVTPMLPPAVSVTPDLCNASVGGVTISNVPGTAPFTYNLYPVGGTAPTATASNASTFSFNGLVAGNYWLELAEAGGRCLRMQVTVTQGTCCTSPAVIHLLVNPDYNRFIQLFPNGVVNVPIAINGVATINQTGPNPITFQCSEVLMGPNARIDLGPNTTLNILAPTHMHGCSDMWDGIYLTSPTTTLNVTGADLRDATNGIVSRNGAPYLVQNTRFENNWWAMQVTDFGGTHPGLVRGCTFTRNGTLKPPMQNWFSRGGILIKNVGNITVGQAGAAVNVFERMNYGVYATTNTNLTAFHNTFRWMVAQPGAPASPAQGSGIYFESTKNATRNLVVGLQSGTSPAQLAQRENIFENNIWGIHTVFSQNAWIRGNSFTGNSENGVFGKFMSGTLTVAQGALTAERNTFTNNRIGLYITSASELAGVVRRNTVTGNMATPREGMRFELLQYPTLILQPNTYRFNVEDLNTIDLRGNGVVVNASDHINIEGNGVLIRSNGPNATQSTNGVFVSACENVRIFNNQIHGNVGIPGTAIPVPTAAFVDTRGVFVTMSPETEVRCNYVHHLGRCVVWEDACYPSIMEKNDMAVAFDGLVLLTQAWIGQQGSLIPRVVSGNTWTSMVNGWVFSTSAIAGSSPLIVKANGNTDPSTGTRNQPAAGNTHVPITSFSPPFTTPNCNQPLNATPNMTAIKEVALNRISNGNFVTESQFRADAWAMGALLRDSSLVQSDSVIQAYYNSFSPTKLGKIEHVRKHLMNQNAFAATLANEAIAPSNATEQNWVDVNGKEILPLDSAFEKYSALEKAELLQLALLCPLSGGKSVFVARALLGFEGEAFWHEDNCVPGSNMKKTANEAEGAMDGFGFKVWPNPSDQSFSVEPKVPSNTDFRMFISNAHGVVLHKVIVNGRGITTLVSRDLAAGIYFLRIPSADGGSWQFKLVVVH